MDLTSTFKAIVIANGLKSSALANAADPLSYTKTIAMSTGSGALQADQSWHDERTLATAAAEELNLSDALVDAFGDAVAFASLKGIYIENLSADDTLLVGGAAADALAAMFGSSSDVLVIRPGGFVMLAAPDAQAYTVTADAADVLRFEHGAQSVNDLTYRVVLVGVAA